MENNKNQKVQVLVADTTAFIQNAQLEYLAESVVTCQAVVDEVMSKRQLKRLVVLPYDLVIRTVFPENVQIVTEFSKKTGDYPSLSATDLQVVALTYQLEKEKVGVEHIRREPEVQRLVIYKGHKKNTEHTVGFHNPKHTDTNDLNLENLHIIDQDDCEDSDEEENNGEDNVDRRVLPSGEETDDNDDDAESDWITPDNLKMAQQKFDGCNYVDDDEAAENGVTIGERQTLVPVACLTTDFAMQNVLKQMNLKVVSLDGRMIRQLRTFILRCYACFKTTSKMTKMFCPKCGNKTLKKVAVSVDENGKMVVHINGRKQLSGRGKKFNIPRIQGGRHAINPLLVEDQPVPQNRPTRLAKMKNNPMDEDYIAGFSPFVMRDVSSRSARLRSNMSAMVKHSLRAPNEFRNKRI